MIGESSGKETEITRDSWYLCSHKLPGKTKKIYIVGNKSSLLERCLAEWFRELIEGASTFYQIFEKETFAVTKLIVESLRFDLPNRFFLLSNMFLFAGSCKSLYSLCWNGDNHPD